MRLTRTWPAVWVKLASSSVCLWLYIWTLVAPVLRPLFHDYVDKLYGGPLRAESSRPPDEGHRKTSEAVTEAEKEVGNKRTNTMANEVVRSEQIKEKKNRLDTKGFVDKREVQNGGGNPANDVLDNANNKSFRKATNEAQIQTPFSEADKEVLRLQDKILRLQEKIAKLQNKVAGLQGLNI